jgi:hypothetical protein
MIVYFGTIVRTAPVSAGGELVRLNWATKTVEARTPIWPREPDLSADPNPRGNSRGCRGISCVNGTVVTASYHTISIFDTNLNLVRDFSHGLMAGIHEIDAYRSDRVWVSCTSVNAALEFDLRTGEVIDQLWPQEIPAIAAYFHLTPMKLDKLADNRARFLDTIHTQSPSHVHLNAVRVWQGHLLALLNRFGAIVDLTAGRVLVHDESLDHAHNLEITDDGLAIVNNTFRQTIHFYDLTCGERVKVISLGAYPVVRRWKWRAWASNLIHITRTRRVKSVVARPIFVRGLDLVGDRLFVGVSPASLLCIGSRSGQLLDWYRYADDVRVCVHGLTVAP